MRLFILGIYAVALVGTCANAAPKAPPVQDGVWTGQKEIASIISGIPANVPPDSTLADRLLRLNIDVTIVNIGRFSEEDVKLSGGELRRGDVDYLFTTTEPSERTRRECELSHTFSITRRGHLWIPATKTANYLMNGAGFCKAP